VSNEIYFDGSRFISAYDAARTVGVTRDYIGRLCRDGRIVGKRVGKLWYVEENSLNAFLVERGYLREVRKSELSKSRSDEYRKVVSPHIGHVGIKRDSTVKSTYDSNVKNTVVRGLFKSSSNNVESPVSVISSEKANRVREMIERGVHSMNDTARQATFHATTLAVHKVPPHEAIDVGQRVAALFLSFLLVFGTYGFVDAQYARFAKESIVRASINIKTAPEKIVAAVSAIDVTSSLNQLASVSSSVANNPAAAALSFGERFSNAFGTVAKSVNDYVDTFVYEIVFTPEVRFAIETVSGPQRNASVEVNVVPYSGDASGNTNTQITQTTQPAGSTTIVQQPVIERVITTERLVTQGGVSESDLIFRLNTLDNKLTSQIYAVSASIPTFSGPAQSTAVTTQTVALLNNIDQLTNTTINTPTISGGTISGATISGGSVTATAFSGTLGISSGGTGTSTSPSYGQVLLGQSDGSYNLVATSSLGITGGGGGSGGDSFAWSLTGYGVSTSTTLGFTNGFLSSASSTISDLFVTRSTTTQATTTNLAITSLASALLSTNANGTVVATTSIGSNLITGSLGTINNTTFNRGDTITITAASSTLLANDNTFSGTNAFQNITATGATTTTLAVTGTAST